jgi:zinc finger CCHC domain-containing protein 9
MVLGVGCEAGADEDDFHALKREVAKDERREAKAKRIINAKAGVFLGVQSSGRPVSTKKVVYF